MSNRNAYIGKVWVFCGQEILVSFSHYNAEKYTLLNKYEKYTLFSVAFLRHFLPDKTFDEFVLVRYGLHEFHKVRFSIPVDSDLNGKGIL